MNVVLALLDPSGKMWFCTFLAALVALLYLGLGLLELRRQVPTQPGIAGVWLTLALGLGLVALGLGVMAAHWGAPRGQRPFREVLLVGSTGAFILLIAVIRLAGRSRISEGSRERFSTG